MRDMTFELGKLGFIVEEVIEQPDGTFTVVSADDDPPFEFPEAGEVKTWKLSDDELTELRNQKVIPADLPQQMPRQKPTGTWISCLNCRSHVFPDWALLPPGAVTTDTVVRRRAVRRTLERKDGSTITVNDVVRVSVKVRNIGGYTSFHGCLSSPPPSWEDTLGGNDIYLLPRCCTNMLARKVQEGILAPMRGRPFMWDVRAGISVSRSWLEYEAMAERAEYCLYFAPWKGSKMDQPWRKTLPKRRAEAKAIRNRK